MSSETRGQADTGEENSSPGLTPGKTFAIWALIVLASVIGVLAATNLWVDRQALNTTDWVEASDRLLQDPEVQQRVSEYLVDELFNAIPLQNVVDGLPPEFQNLAGLAAGALRGPAIGAVESMVRTDEFRSLWVAANREAHTLLVTVLEGGTDVVSTTGGEVSLNLQELLSELTQRLGFSGSLVDQLPDDAGVIEIASSDRLESLQNWVTFVKWASPFLLILVIGLYGWAVYLAEGRRRETLRSVGWAVVVVGLVILIGRRIGTEALVSQVDNPANRPTAAAAYAIGSELLHRMSWAAILYGVVIVLGAILAGPGELVTKIRRWLSPALNAPPLWFWGGAALIFLLLILWAPLPAFNTWYTVVILGVLIAAGLAVLRNRSLQEFPTA